MKRKVGSGVARAERVRAVSPAMSSRGFALRAVLLAAVAASAGCDPVEEISRGARRAGEWLGVLDAPRMAGEMPAVHPAGAIKVPLTHASGSASSAPSAVRK